MQDQSEVRELACQLLKAHRRAQPKKSLQPSFGDVLRHRILYRETLARLEKEGKEISLDSLESTVRSLFIRHPMFRDWTRQHVQNEDFFEQLSFQAVLPKLTPPS